jgi:regulator of replication initiation timing
VLMKDGGELDTNSQEVDDENDGIVVMKDDDELHTYSQELDDDGDTEVVRKDDDRLDTTYSPSDVRRVKARLLGEGFGMCNIMVCTEDFKEKDETAITCLKLIQTC